jgi:multiple sugar transport system ATP-binding protein
VAGNEQYGYINFDPPPKVRDMLNTLAREMDAD